MDIDPSRFEPGVWAALAAFLLAGIEGSAVVFGMPPPDRRAVMRACYKWFMAAPMAMIFGYGFAAPVTAMANALVSGWFDGKMQIDPIGAGILLGLFSVRGLTLIYDIGLRMLAKKLEGAV